MKKYLLKLILAATLLGVQIPSFALDIDVYVTSNQAQADLPNVLFVVDNTANWNTPFTNQMAALKSIFENLPQDQFRIGIMMFTETGGGNSGNDGGYIRAAIRQMTASNKLLYKDLINGLDKTGDKSNGGKGALAMAEAYRYFSAGAPFAGNNKNKTDYTGNTSGTAQDDAVHALTGNALATKSATTYANPVTSGCQKNYIIYISNGPAQDNSSDISSANSMLTAAGGSTTQITLSPSGSQENPADEWARFMYQSTKKIVTYTIDVGPGSTGQGPGWTALLKSMASVSKGTYTAVSATATADTFVDIINSYLSQIQAVNSVFAAVSLPASADVQGTYKNQLFIAMFRPDAASKPLWTGNLKQYQISAASQNLVDANGDYAINTNTGFITECAQSFWTPSKTTGVDSYWSADPKGDCIPPTGQAADYYKNSNTPDGNIVEKGGQAYNLRAASYSTRTVKTCSSTVATCSSTGMVDFDNSNVSTSDLGATDATERDTLINWTKGQNADNELLKGTSVMRPTVHGDVIHSAPMALSYNDGDNVVVFYGGNDGIFRAVNGNQTGNIGSVIPGGEMWAFVPPEFYGHIKRLRTNTELINFTKKTTETQTGTAKPYGIDGPLKAYRDAANTKTWLFATMRRGGRSIYAFNVTDPASPTIKWKVGCPNLSNDTGCTTDFSDLGQTWSAAQPILAAGYYSGDKPLLIMGGGYDTCEDDDTTAGRTNCMLSGKGRYIYVLDAEFGTYKTKLPTARGVIGEIAIVPDADGNAKYGYAADLGGTIYRITMGASAPADWTITPIAKLGCATPTDCTNARKFQFTPSVVVESDGVHAIYLGTGDREKPLNSDYFPNATGTTNYFFKVIDKPTDATWLSSESTTCGSAIICLASLGDAGSTSSGCGGITTSTDKGWKMAMRSTEQVVTSVSTLYDIATFWTHVPTSAAAASCTNNLGTTRVYNLSITTAKPKSGTTCDDQSGQGGLPPSPSKIKVCLNAAGCDSASATTDICIGCSSSAPIDPQNNTPATSSASTTNAKRRMYWYIEQ